MSRLFEKPEDMGEYIFRITDNGGRTFDRYTVVFSDGTYLGLSKNPTHPQGFSQAGEDIDLMGLAEEVEAGNSIDLALGDLPPGLAEHIMYRNNEGAQDWIDRVERSGFDVAKSREKASVNEGLSSSFGIGLYKKDDAYMIRIDGIGPEEDLGPYDTVIEAIRATLPQHYDCTGPEYFSTVDDVCRMTPDAEVLAAVKTLEDKVTEEWEASRGPGYFG